MGAPPNRSATRPARSLRARLLLFLLGAIAVFALAQGLSAYRNALRQADAMFDYHLQQMALSLRTGIALAPVPPDFDPGQDDSDILVQIWGADGAQLFRSPRSALPRSAALLGFSDVRVHGREYRLYTVQTPRQTIQIAQDLSARTARARALAAHAVLPIALLAPLLMLAVWWIVTRAVRPIERTRRQVAARAADDLSPLPDAGLPSEVQPLVAELNALFDRVREAFDAQKNFVADAAHELRSPLTALKLQAQALRHQNDAEPARSAAVARLNQGIDRAIRLVEQMLALANAQAGADDLRERGAFAPVDLGSVARLAAADLLPEARSAAIELSLTHAAADDAANTPILVRGDAEALRTLVSNLLSNAIKYTPAPGRVELSLRRDDDRALLTVDDSGPGIAPGDRERAFDRFFRASDASAHGASGSGLGLAIVQAIGKRHGARLRLGDAPELGGLRVELRLPLAP